MLISIFGPFAHLFLLLQYIVELVLVIFLWVRNNWYESYNSTIIEIGAQKSQSGLIAWPNKHAKWPTSDLTPWTLSLILSIALNYSLILLGLVIEIFCI